MLIDLVLVVWSLLKEFVTNRQQGPAWSVRRQRPTRIGGDHDVAVLKPCGFSGESTQAAQPMPRAMRIIEAKITP
ncbi:MAG TPA: hypothetical protein VKI44_05695 [Acetobacteraceae bacterium]|nr:hypothetical protein [Acetobacteraceae bacterium]